MAIKCEICGEPKCDCGDLDKDITDKQYEEAKINIFKGFFNKKINYESTVKDFPKKLKPEKDEVTDRTDA